MKRKQILADFYLRNIFTFKEIDLSFYQVIFLKEVSPLTKDASLAVFNYRYPQAGKKNYLEYDSTFLNLIDLKGFQTFKKSDFLGLPFKAFYYDKEYSALDFEYLITYPFFEEKEVIGFLFLFAKTEPVRLNLNRQAIYYLFKDLKDFEYEEVKEAFLQNKQDYYLLYNDEVYQILNNSLNKTSLEDYKEVGEAKFFGEKVKLIDAVEKRLNVLNSDAFKKEDLKDFKKLIFLKTDSLNLFKKELATELIYYFVDDYYFFLSNDSAPFIKNVLKKLKYYCILDLKADVSLKMDLNKLFNYLKEVEPKTYKKDDYLKYLEQVGKENINASFYKSQKFNLVVDDLEVVIVGSLLSLLKNHLEKEKVSINNLDMAKKAIKKGERSLALCVSLSFLNDKKFSDFLNKYNELFDDLYLIVYSDDYLLKSIIKHPKVHYLMDASLFADFNFKIDAFWEAGFLLKDLSLKNPVLNDAYVNYLNHYKLNIYYGIRRS